MTSTSHPVFISYPRRDMALAAAALHKALGPGVSFLDSDAIEAEDIFPRRLAEALESASVVVVLATPGYFERWYCLREWMVALLPWTEAARGGGVPNDDLLEHVVVAWDGSLSETDLQRLPPAIRKRTLTSSSETATLERIVRARLTRRFPSLGHRLAAAGGRAAIELFTDDAALPLIAQSTSGLRTWPVTLPQSLGERFLGRADEFWRVHEALWTRRMGGIGAATKTVGLHGGGGVGKSQLAIEYVHRMGPRLYRDGLFWVDAALPLEDQHRGILAALGEPPAIAQLLSGQPLRDALATKLSPSVPASILVVVDNLPEATDVQPTRALSDYCPALGRVSCLVTSRARRWDVDTTIDLDVVSPSAAVLILQRDLRVTTPPPYSDWEAIAEWVGRLPLALDLINKAVQGSAVLPDSFVEASRTVAVSPRLDALAALLKDEMPPGAVRGITEAFSRSLAALRPSARRFALACGWLASSAIPRELLSALADGESAEAEVQLLVFRSFLTASETGAGPVRMHRVMSSFLQGATANPSQVVGELSAALQRRLDVVDRSGGEQLLILLAPHVAEIADRLVQLSPSGPPVINAIELLDRLVLAGARAAAAAPLLYGVRGARAVLARVGTGADTGAIGHVNRVLGRSLYELGTRQTSTTLLAEAMVANQAALGAFRQDTQADEWARIKNQIGVTLHEWGQREPDGALLDEALAAFDAVLPVRVGKPLDWAATQNNIANALMEKAQRLEDPAIVTRAIEAYRAALRIYDSSPDTHALANVVRSNLGSVFRVLGELTNEVEHFAAGERELLQVWPLYPRNREPVRWADVANNIGLVRVTWGARTKDASRIREGLGNLSASLEFRPRAESPVDWAMTQNNLGRAYTELGKCEGSARLVWHGVMALKRALRVRLRSTLPLDWGTSTMQLARAFAALGVMQESQELIGLSAAAYADAMDEYDRVRFTREWTRMKDELNAVLAAGAQLGDGGSVRRPRPRVVARSRSDTARPKPQPKS